MLHASFNADCSRLACGYTNGYSVYNCDPPKEMFTHKTSPDPNGVGIISGLYKSNIFALVGGGPNPRYPPNKLVLWDDSTQKMSREMDFASPVTGVQLTNDLMFVTTIDTCYIYKLWELNLIEKVTMYSGAPILSVV